MNLGDPELELIDPTPNVHSLFIHFDKLFFWTKLASRAVVRWSKRMYSCAGICSYEGRGGLCDIALSEPLLKLRPRKDLVETLLHEMIHAFLFITSRDRDRDGHGPNFQSHMHRINKLAGINITIYHDFHDEVKLYLTHWWRCNGPCQSRKPYFGIVRRSSNRAPGPNDYWWKTHQKTCGGTFVKIKEPEKHSNKKASKAGADITKYINNNNKTVVDKNISQTTKKQPKGVLKDASNTTLVTKVVVKGNMNGTVVITHKGSSFSPTINKQKSPTIDDKANISGGRKRTQSANVLETVRNVWANKQLPNIQNPTLDVFKEKGNKKSRQSTGNATKSNKHKPDKSLSDSPPHKIKKIDDYFKKVATSVLKDVYGEDFKISQSKTDNKLVAGKVKMVDCPICNVSVKEDEINGHLDECLNKGVIEKLSKDSGPINPTDIPTVINSDSLDKPKLKRDPPIKLETDLELGSRDSPKISSKIKTERVDDSINLADISIIKKEKSSITGLIPKKRDSKVDCVRAGCSNEGFDEKDLAKVKSIAKKINYDKHLHKTGLVEPEKKGQDVDFGYLPSFLDDMACEIELPAVKIEPGLDSTSVENPKCPCCGDMIDKPIEQHLDDCLAFFGNNDTTPEEGASTSFANETIVIDDDDDVFDETQTLNATGTKCPCPCCLQMVEQADMNNHLDVCLSS